MKFCVSCQSEGPFYNTDMLSGGLTDLCRACHDEAVKEEWRIEALSTGNGRSCSRCGEPVDRQGNARICSWCITYKSGRHRICVWCGIIYKRSYAHVYCGPGCYKSSVYATKKSKQNPVRVDSKDCSGCGVNKPQWAFARLKSSKTGLKSRCRECYAKKHREWKASPEARTKMHASRIKAKYGLTADDYQMIFNYQKATCGLCGKPAEAQRKRLSVDHDHDTGLVRSLACDVCNKYKISNLTIDDVKALYRYFMSPPATQALGREHFVPKGMENPKKRKQPRKRPRGKNNG